MSEFEPSQRFVVTGASSGIGEAVALMLNKKGASVVCIGRDADRLEALKHKAAFPANVVIEQKDLIEQIDALPDYMKSLKDKYGKFQGVACCA